MRISCGFPSSFLPLFLPSPCSFMLWGRASLSKQLLLRAENGPMSPHLAIVTFIKAVTSSASFLPHSSEVTGSIACPCVLASHGHSQANSDTTRRCPLVALSPCVLSTQGLCYWQPADDQLASPSSTSLRSCVFLGRMTGGSVLSVTAH